MHHPVPTIRAAPINFLGLGGAALFILTPGASRQHTRGSIIRDHFISPEIGGLSDTRLVDFTPPEMNG